MYTTKSITRMGMLAALSVVLASLIHFPLFPAASFLEYDPADVPILLTAFWYGPLAGVLVTALVCLIQGLTVSASGGLIGILMHFIATSVFCIVAGVVYNRNPSQKGRIIGILFGVVAMAVTMCGCNLVFTPIYTGMPVSDVAKMIVPIILPFNLLKAGINGIVAYLLFAALQPVFQRSEA